MPAPRVGKKNILVQVTHSCISVGTEIAGVKMSGLSLYQRALKQPDNVKRVLEMVRTQGLKRTLNRIRGKLAAGSATGYSAAGVIVEIGEEVTGFAIGEQVACAGGGIANHAEIIDVPVNLAVKIPDNVGTNIASTVTLGAIAMQGVRRAQPTLGETFVVMGLGILGQITTQLLSANGCRVIGMDLDVDRVNLAINHGMDIGINPTSDHFVQSVLNHTKGIGADAVIITASTQSNQVIRDAMQVCRKKGRVVLVGDVGLELQRADFYQKELDLLISTSYGPGRYDPFYEDEGQDYPIAYVRWTENRNMQAYMDLLSKGKIKLEALYQPYPIEKAAEAYACLKSEGKKPLLVLLEYPTREEARGSQILLPSPKKSGGKICVALAGASSFAQGMHLPNLLKLKSDFRLQAVMSRTGGNALAIATQYDAHYCTTEYQDILSDPDVDLVMIATRHDLHASMALQALRANKHVFVEKPLALKAEEILEIERFYAESDHHMPLLMVGFNRRFSPAIQRIRSILEKRTTPMIVNYRMNAGFIPLDHWVHTAEGGGRNIGEACHIYDLFNALTGACALESVHAYSISPRSQQWARNDNFVASLKYVDGSICTLTYTALGNKSYPKEELEIFTEGKVIVMHDYQSVKVYGSIPKNWTTHTGQKGHLEELRALAETLINGACWPISLEEQLQASRVSFEVERQIYNRDCVEH